MKKKKVLGLMMATVMVLSTFIGCGAKEEAPAAEETSTEEVTTEEEISDSKNKKFVIGYSQYYFSAPFVKALAAGAEAACEEWKEQGYDVELILTDAGSDGDFASQQVRDMEDLAVQNIDALLVFPGDSASIGSAIETIYNVEDIPVVVTDIGVSSGEYLSFLITDNTYAGSVAAEILAEQLEPGAKVVAFNSSPGRINANQRVEGFMNRAKELGLEVLDQMPMEATVESGATNMEDLLVSVPDIGGVFFIESMSATGAAGVIEDAGADVKSVSFDLSATTYEMIKEGKLTGTVVQDPFYMGNEGFNQAMYYLTGQTDKIQKEIPAESSACTIDNYEDYANDIQVSQ